MIRHRDVSLASSRFGIKSKVTHVASKFALCWFGVRLAFNRCNGSGLSHSSIGLYSYIPYTVTGHGTVLAGALQASACRWNAWSRQSGDDVCSLYP